MYDEVYGNEKSTRRLFSFFFAFVNRYSSSFPSSKDTKLHFLVRQFFAIFNAIFASFIKIN